MEEEKIEKKEKPKFWKKRVGILGKQIPVVVLLLVAVGGLGSAALLAYYGTITATVNVQQSILLDNKAWPDSQVVEDIIPEEAPGGEKFCSKHILTNQMSVEGSVNLQTTCHNNIPDYGNDCTGITTACLESNNYAFAPTNSIGTNAEVLVSVEDTGSCQISWTFDFPIDTNLGNGNMGYGLIISTDGVHPVFQIHNNDGTCSHWAWGTPLYSEWDDTILGNWNGWNTGGANCANTNEVLPSWITATGHRYKDGKSDDPTPNPTGMFTVTIDKCELGVQNVYWATSFGSGGFNSPYGGQSVLPSGFTWTNSKDVNLETTHNYYTAQVAKPCTNLIASGQTKPFCLCYEFAQGIWPGQYVITTGIKPQTTIN